MNDTGQELPFVKPGPGFHVRWMRMMCRHGGFSPGVVIVGMLLASFSDFTTGERIFPSRAELRDITGYSRSMVTDAIDQLIAGGWLIRVSAGRRGSNAEFRLTSPGDVDDQS